MTSRRKSLSCLSDRQKRRLRQQIVKGLSYASHTQESLSEPQEMQSSNLTNLVTNNLSKPAEIPFTTRDSSTNLSGPNKISDFENAVLCRDPSSDSHSNNQDFDSDVDNCTCNECVNLKVLNKENLWFDLKIWATECNIPLSHISKLLKILNKHKLYLPLDARTLLGTPKEIKTSVVEPGEYCHLGIQNEILKRLNVLPESIAIPFELKFNVNVDGLSLSKSSGSSFWPILCWFDSYHENKLCFKPFPIGIYHGYHKPKSANDLYF